MRKAMLCVLATMLLCVGQWAAASDSTAAHDQGERHEHAPRTPFKVEQQKTQGSVSVEGRGIDYDAYAGTLVVHPQGWSDVPSNNETKGDTVAPVASMSYVAYMKTGAKAADRPVTFLYNGGPGSATVWLHMGAFGPRRVITEEHSHTPAAPYRVENNQYSLLDASDLVFVDAPGTGFGRIAGKDRKDKFYGVDQDAHAFAEFITRFLSKYGRWNSPKYLFGESYGTTRSAVLVDTLQTDYQLDVNGVILLSQILAFDASVDAPQWNPGVELPYLLALPTYTATAFYHHKLPNPPDQLEPLLEEVEQFAMGPYASALHAGSALSDDRRHAVAEQLHRYTGLPVDYIEKADLRINGGEFEKTLLGDDDVTTGRLDTRFTGPTMDPLSKEAEYDPQAAAISSAYISAFNDYVRNVLKFGRGKTYKPTIDVWQTWNFRHQPPGAGRAPAQAANVMPDLAHAMKFNPRLQIMLNGGYFDLATPFFEGIYEMRHLPIEPKLQDNIEYHYYASGHMVYAHEASLKALHDNVAAFIRRTAAAR